MDLGEHGAGAGAGAGFGPGPGCRGRTAVVLAVMAAAFMVQRAAAAAVCAVHQRRLAQRKRDGWKRYHAAVATSRKAGYRGSVKHRRKRLCR